METDSAVPALGEGDCDWTGTFTWRVENWTRLAEEEVYSPEFEIGGYTWRLLIYPRGGDGWRGAGYISVYLEFPDASFTPRRMCPKAKFVVIAVNHKCLNKSQRLEASHTFSTLESSWGFAEFLSIQKVLNPETGYLMNDAFTLRVNVLVEIDGILGMTSKFETGFVGIEYLKDTTLLASFLQCMFHIKAIRKAVFRMTTLAPADRQRTFPLALQHLFYKFKYQNTSAEIMGLVKALDWDLSDVLLHHDIRKIQHILFDKLAKDFRANSVLECISRLLTGKHSTCIESLVMQDAPTFKQSFTDISLDVLDSKDIYASLEKLCQVQRLREGNPRCKITRELGEFKHYTLFDSFPPVLLFHLERFHYNPDREVILKTNSYYEFYDELDLDYNDHVLLSKNADQTFENKYRLQSVVVHKGGLEGARYFAFVRHHEKWYKFDSEVVKEVSSEEAISAQFGDQNGAISANLFKEPESINKSTAVMLVYIRKSEWERVMCEAGDKCLPMEVRKFFDKKLITKKEQRKKKEAHFYVNIKLATECHFTEHIGRSYYLGLAGFDKVKSYRIYKNTLFEDFKEIVSKGLGIPKHLQRFWKWTSQANNIMRVVEPIIEEEHDLKTVLDLRHFRDDTSHLDKEKPSLMTIKLFLESPEKTILHESVSSNNLRPIEKNELLIFVKYYDPGSSKLSYLGHVFAEQDSTLRVVFEEAKKMAGLSCKDKVFGIKEVKYSPTIICSDLDPDTTLERMQLLQGDIIIIQKIAANSCYKYPTFRSFLEFLQNSMIVNFRPLKNPKDEGLKLRLLKTVTYEQVTTELAKQLQVDDPKKLRLTQNDISSCLPYRTPIRYNGNESQEQMILHGTQYNNTLYYTILDNKLACLETLSCLTIEFHNSKGALQSRNHLMLSKDDTVSGLVKALKAELGVEYNNCDMRIMKTLFSKVFKVLDSESPLKSVFEDYSIVRAEVIPEDQKHLKSDDYLVLFCHCKPNDNSQTTFGDPLWVKVKTSETVGEVKVRIQKTLEISNEEFSHWTIAYHARPMRPMMYLSDQDEIVAQFLRIARNRKTNRKFLGDDATFIALVHKDARHNRYALQH